MSLKKTYLIFDSWSNFASLYYNPTWEILTSLQHNNRLKIGKQSKTAIWFAKID